MAVKYQVFISSTYDDLQMERNQAIKAILEMGHIPVGMEMFSAADEEQWKIITRHIDESDYYCVLIAHRYGSEVEGISYTRREYEYALSKGIPILGFIIESGVAWPPEKIDKASGTVKKLDDFKTLVKQKPVSFWRSADDLSGKVSIALGKQITANPRDGWVRASSVAGPEVTAELTRLSAENARLRGQLAEAEKESEAEHAAVVTALWNKLSDLKTDLSYKYSRSDQTWTVSRGNSYAWLFYCMSASLATELEVDDAAKSLAMNLREDKSQTWFTVATNQVADLLADLMALDLVEPSKRKHTPSDTGEYWSLTDLGRDVQKYMRIQLMDDDDGKSFAGTLVKKATTRKAPAKKVPAKKAPAKKVAAKKGAAKKASASAPSKSASASS